MAYALGCREAGMKKFFVLTSVLIFLCSLSLADEGMWLYNQFPKSKVEAKYGFAPTDEFLEHLRLSSVRMGASASFVSPDGLVFTNHHVGATCIHNISTPEHDYMKTGFFARTRAEEAKCPGQEIAVLIDITDVTDKVNASLTPAMSAPQAATAQRAAMAKLEKDCSQGADVTCQIVTLYAGAMYHLYKYRQYHDVRLVMAPEYDAAFFGGDPDNFTYPRYDLDITFFRVYENGKPVHVDHYLKWSPTGVKEGDLVFVSGHPGATGRLLTLPELEFRRDVQYPFSLRNMAHRIDVLKKFMAESADNARIAERALFSVQNTFKAQTGYQSGLLNKASMTQKAVDEKALRDWVINDPGRKAQYGDPWGEIEKAMKTERELFVQEQFIEGTIGLRGTMAQTARLLVRLADERTKPSEQRLRGFQDSALPGVERRLTSAAPVFKSLEERDLADGLTEMRAQLGAENPVVKKVLNGRTPAEAAKQMIQGSKLDDPAFRKQLFDGGKAAVDASTDPLIAVMKAIDPEARAIRKRVEDEVDAPIRSTGATLAKIRFARYGTAQAPDATGTLRLNYGVVKSYQLEGKTIPHFTTFAGAFEHASKNNNQPPYQLPESWFKAKSKLDLTVPLNTVNTADSIGGNSGSPTVNTKGEIVGILFDGNIQSLPWNFFFDDTVGRTVIVDSRGIVEALRKIYNAGPLADELLGTKASAGGSK